jgi:hypothetical protein
LGALCDFYRRQFNQELDWCERQEKLSFKGVAWTGSYFGNRTKRQAIIAYKRGIKADRAIMRELPLQANRLIRAPVSFDTQGRQGKGRPVNGTCRKNGSTPQGGMATRLPHAETQNTRRARSFDSWIHLEGTTREWQIYLPYRRHRAINRALALEGAKLATSAEVFFKNDKWYAELFVNVPLPATDCSLWAEL